MASGHSNVRARHESTLEVTTDDWLTPAGDCILGIDAEKAPVDIDSAFVRRCQERSASISLTLQSGEHIHTVTGHGDPALTFESDRSFVCRTSDYVDDRTVLIEADTAAADIDREFINRLQDGEPLRCTLRVD